ncbi:MAG: hypothetical protein KDA81_14195 [Planctomycetaceae bacterium]|nr:hypothetical protein [Planctomycetaceae bacterium]
MNLHRSFQTSAVRSKILSERSLLKVSPLSAEQVVTGNDQAVLRIGEEAICEILIRGFVKTQAKTPSDCSKFERRKKLNGIMMLDQRS